jgi:hypothetical protein
MLEQFLLLRLGQRIHGGFDLMEGVHAQRLALHKHGLQVVRKFRDDERDVELRIGGHGGHGFLILCADANIAPLCFPGQ